MAEQLARIESVEDEAEHAEPRARGERHGTTPHQSSGQSGRRSRLSVPVSPRRRWLELARHLWDEVRGFIERGWLSFPTPDLLPGHFLMSQLQQLCGAQCSERLTGRDAIAVIGAL